MTYVSTKLKREIQIDEIITIHYFEYMKDFYFAGEAHDFWEFLYVDKGSINVKAGNTEFLLHTGDVIFHKPNEFHAIRSSGEKPPNLVAISFYCSSPAIAFFHNKYFTLNLREKELISLIIAEARQAFATPLHIPSVEQVALNDSAPFAAGQLILNYLEQFLIETRRAHSDPDNAKPASLPFRSNIFTAKSDNLEHLVQYMEFHICEQLSVQDLCNASSLSRSALQALFKREKGCGAMEYFNHLKIERAKEIIRDGKMTHTEIAHFLSYSSLQYFSRQFKKATKMSPLEYASSVKDITDTVKNVTTRIVPPTKNTPNED